LSQPWAHANLAAGKKKKRSDRTSPKLHL
jgi:hypothetical protein